MMLKEVSVDDTEILELADIFLPGNVHRLDNCSFRTTLGGGLGMLDSIGEALSGEPPGSYCILHLGQRSQVNLIRGPVVKPLMAPPHVVPIKPYGQFLSCLRN